MTKRRALVYTVAPPATTKILSFLLQRPAGGATVYTTTKRSDHSLIYNNMVDSNQVGKKVRLIFKRPLTSLIFCFMTWDQFHQLHQFQQLLKKKISPNKYTKLWTQKSCVYNARMRYLTDKFNSLLTAGVVCEMIWRQNIHFKYLLFLTLSEYFYKSRLD